MSNPMRKPAGNVDLLRHKIDSGLANDKVDFPDPAAAPLGTDEEAAGERPTAREVDSAMRQLIGEDEVGEEKPSRPWLWPLLIILAAAAAAILLVV